MALRDDSETIPATAQVAFARVLQREGRKGPVLDPSFALLESIVPGTTVERYGRIWRMARFAHSDPYVNGRIGFEEPGSLEELWNESVKDFEERRLTLGTTSPFVLDLLSLRVAFQLRTNRIRLTTFTGNFQALINLGAARSWLWKVQPEVVGIGWEDWVESVDRVVEISIRLNRPNPSYGQRRRVRDLIEGTNAEMVRMVLRALKDSPEGLRIDEGFVAEAIEHTDEYGHRKAVGEREDDGETVVSRWSDEVEGVPQREDVEVDPQTREVTHEALRGKLEQRAAEEES